MGSGERNSELYLKLLIEQLHGVSLTQHDRDGRQGAVDYMFRSPSVSGAVEMTTVQDGRAAAWGSKLGGGETIECHSPWGWTVVVDLGTRLARMDRHQAPHGLAASQFSNSQARASAWRWPLPAAPRAMANCWPTAFMNKLAPCTLVVPKSA